MRISLILLFAVAFQLSAENGYAQRMKRTLNLTRVSVEQVLNQIEKNSDYVFLYHDNTIQTDRIVSLDKNARDIPEILDKVFAGTNVNYSIVDKQIILSTHKTTSFQQSDIKLSGTVKDMMGEPLIGVSILVKGTTNGTVTDLDGKFSLQVAKGAVIEISYIGYITQTMTVTGTAPLSIVMKEDSKQLDEVVVTALGIKREAKALTYKCRR